MLVSNHLCLIVLFKVESLTRNHNSVVLYCYGNAAVGGSGCLFHREAPEQDRQLSATNVAQPGLAQQMKQRGTPEPGARAPQERLA